MSRIALAGLAATVLLAACVGVSGTSDARGARAAVGADDRAAAGADDRAAAGADGAVDVVVTFSVLADFVEHVGGDRVRVTTLAPIGGDPHTHEPTPSDSRAISEADLVVDNGLGLAPWFEHALVGAATGEVLVLATSLDDLAMDDPAGGVDPHLWLVPEVVADRYLPAIAEALTAVDPDGAADYTAAAGRYADVLRDLHVELAQTLDAIPAERRKLVTSHDAYSYFAAAYGLEVLGTPVGVTTEEQPSATTVARLIDAVREASVPTIFVESTVNPSVIESIARDAGVEVGAALYGDSLGPPGSGADTYVGMLRANADALVAGLAR